MGTVTYDNKRIIPAPFVSVQKNYQKTGDGTNVGSVFQLNITGTLVAWKGSPDSSEVFHTTSGYPVDEVIDDDERLGALMRKVEALRELFSNEGRQLEFQSLDGSAPMKCNPRNVSLQFNEGLWYNRIDYTITCECDVLYVNNTILGEDGFTELIESAEETWSLDTQDGQLLLSDFVSGGGTLQLGGPQTFTLTHSVSAKGKRFYLANGELEKPAWQQARDFVLPRLGFDSTIVLSSGVNNLPSYYGGFNHIRNESIDELGGNYSVTETWVISSGSALEDYTVNTTESASDGVKRVSIEGRVTGLEERNASTFNLVTTKYSNAASRFSEVVNILHTRAQAFSGLTLNLIPQNSSIGRNPVTGIINYTYEYDNRPSNLIDDTKSEVIAVGTRWNVDVVAAIGVINRSRGPVLQSIGTHEGATRTLNLELVFGPEFVQVGANTIFSRINSRNPRFVEPYASQIQEIVNAANPQLAGIPNNIGEVCSTNYVTDQNESWDAINGRYSLNVAWLFE